jgi:hypothetical protein
MELVYGAGKLDRRVAEVERLLRDWREREKDFGQLYLEFERHDFTAASKVA